jgi:hypothetical protein
VGARSADWHRWAATGAGLAMLPGASAGGEGSNAVGRITAFAVRWQPPVREEVALSAVPGLLPPDAQSVYREERWRLLAELDDQCLVLQYRSPMLGSLMPEDPSGVVLVRLMSQGPGGAEQPYISGAVNTLTISATGTLGEKNVEC